MSVTQFTASLASQQAANLQQQIMQQMQSQAGVSNYYAAMTNCATTTLSSTATTTPGISTSAVNSYVHSNALSNAFTTTTGAWGSIADDYRRAYDELFKQWCKGDWYLKDGTRKKIHLPDGTVIELLETGSFLIHDQDAKVIYRANRVRDFNKYLNVSDRLEEFVKFCGQQKLERGEFLELPLKLFLGWLVIEAAKADQEPPPADIKLIPDLRKVIAPRCVGCGRFLPRYAKQKQLSFCAPPCFERHYNRAIPAPEVNQCQLALGNGKRLPGIGRRDQRAARLQVAGGCAGAAAAGGDGLPASLSGPDPGGDYQPACAP